MTNNSEPEVVEGRILDPREWPPIDEHGWWLWSPGKPV